MMLRLATRAGVAALAAATAWIALWSWGGLVEQPRRFMWPAMTGAILIVAVGAAGRTLRWRWYAVLPVQLVVLGTWLNRRYAEAESWSGWIPTPESVRVVADEIRDGAVAVNTYSAPVSTEHPETYAYLLVTALLVMISTDLLACGLRRVPWAGLPVIVTLTVPISVLEAGLSWVIFVSTALLFVMLLATEETERVLGWGRSIAGQDHRVETLDQVVNGATVRGSAFRIGLLTAAGALVLPLFVPVTSGLFKDGDGDGPGSGSGASSVRLRNPIVDLRRDLISQENIPLVEARTEGDPTYLRLAVLDRFNGNEWLPSSRRLAQDNRARGALPPAPGISPTARGAVDDWVLRIEEEFDTTWLPTPYPTRRIDIERGDWRYDLRTLDIATVDETDTADLRYELTGFAPEIDGARLADAPSTPLDVRGPMTNLPSNIPPVISQLARQVTADATSDYERMVQLQTWFRNSGGFSYSLDQGDGSGLTQLARFITEEKVGYCEQFAAAMAVMGRTLGIASRVVVGFLEPEERLDGRYVYTSDDLHAWPEMYFSGAGWVRFEPTPSARTGRPPSWTIDRTEPEPSAAPSAAVPSAAARPDETDADTGASGSDSGSSTGTTAAAWLAGLLLVLLALAVPRTVRLRQRARRLGEETEARAVADGAWSELCATAEDLRIGLPLDRSVREVAGVLHRRARPGTDAHRILDDLVDFVERARYARPFEVDERTRTEVHDAVRTWSEVLAESVPSRQARIARLLPWSVLDRRSPTPPRERELEMVGSAEVR